jgi:hypothetical protein
MFPMEENGEETFDEMRIQVGGWTVAGATVSQERVWGIKQQR